ncbi:MAG: peptidylprolyl isomerase [Anaerolineales bacterium]|jgi:parvulin-like peptidyl-prolyl isomerase|nr:peptidylprolyl isomerase [Anaerolineales bacterium]HJO33179.1 peptidylprolyl isomerase [Anaerolineales bacterium]|tara:strand:- start:665 stop:1867 length:1203 start_codon:yes stop_codon:yes gene_type:complete
MGSNWAAGSGRPQRRRMHHGKRERSLKVWLLVATAAVTLLVVGLLGHGLLQQYWFTPRRAVAIVGLSEISLRTLQQQTRYRRVQLLNEYITYSELLQYAGEQRGQLQARLDQIDDLLNEPVVLARQVTEELIATELVRAEASARGITVGVNEIEAAANAYFGYDPDAESPTLAPTAVIDAEPEGDPAPTPFPTPTPFTEAAYQETYSAHLETLSADTGMNETGFRELFERRLLIGKVRDAVAAELDVAEEQQVHARHILLSRDEFETAQDVLERALAGEDFTALAAEFSADASNSKTGGELGWFPRGQMVAAFENAVFSAEAGVLPEPVESQFGWHVVEVLQNEVRALPENIFEQRRRMAFDDWLAGRRAETDIEILDWWEELAPAEPTLQDFYARLRSE